MRIVVSGIISQHPRLGGMTWHYLNYLLGLRQLGHDVYYFEDSGLFPYEIGRKGDSMTELKAIRAANLRYLAGVLAQYGIGDRWAYRSAPESRWFGLSDTRRAEVVDTADLLLNVSGSLEKPGRYRRIPRLAYIDTDPVVTQIKYLTRNPRAFPARVDAHDVHFSFGERAPRLEPETGHRWRPTRQPVFLAEWTPVADARDAFTTIMNWTSYPPLRFEQREYAQKDAEFQRYFELPSMVAPTPMEVAMAPKQHRSWQTQLDHLPSGVRELMAAGTTWTPQSLLERTGWRVVDANRACADFESYRDYIRTSRGEWSVAKNAYVAGHCGWFSERSACYLAAGRPVIVQDTGFSEVLPVGEGLLAFTDVAEAAAAIRDVEAAYARHCEAAQALADAYFDSDKILTDLIERAFAE